MFGFGMSAKDKWCLGQVEMLMAPIAKAMEKDVKPLARQLFDATKTEFVSKHGQDIYTETFGDKLIADNKDFVERRVAAGLTINDIRTYWNQPLLMQSLQCKVLEASEFISLNLEIARKTGKALNQLSGDELTSIVRDRRKTEPRWGDPDQWNPDLPVNFGFSVEDADIYIEFYYRVGRWWDIFTEKERLAYRQSTKFSSFNAIIRNRIRKGVI